MYQIANYCDRYRPYDKSGGELRNPEWVKMPCKPKGDGLQTLLEYPRGLEIFGIWCLILQKTTKEKKPENRGKLLNHRELPASIPEIAKSISLGSKIKLVNNAISVLVEMGWVIDDGFAEESSADFRKTSAKSSVPKGSVPNHTLTLFDRFWSAYPKKVSKKDALKAFNKIRPTNELFEKMLSAVRDQKNSDQWKKDNGQYIPNPATWLNGDKWTDVLPHKETIAEQHARLKAEGKL